MPTFLIFYGHQVRICFFSPTLAKSTYNSGVVCSTTRCVCPRRLYLSVRHHVSRGKSERYNARTISTTLKVSLFYQETDRSGFIQTFVGVAAYLCPRLIPTHCCVPCAKKTRWVTGNPRLLCRLPGICHTRISCTVCHASSSVTSHTTAVYVQPRGCHTVVASAVVYYMVYSLIMVPRIHEHSASTRIIAGFLRIFCLVPTW